MQIADWNDRCSARALGRLRFRGRWSDNGGQGKRAFEQIAQAVADPGRVLGFGAVQSHARHLGWAAKQVRLVSWFDTQAAVARLAELIEKHANRSMSFADACLVCRSEQTRGCKIVTIDRANFAAYRRHGREAIPLLAPD